MEPDVSNLMTVQQAIEIIDAAPVSCRRIRVPLLEAPELRLAQDILSDRDYPPFDKSLMDGFAIRAADAKGESFMLRVVGEIAAGSKIDREVGAGECMSIYTGAPLPPGADSVVPVEFSRDRSSESVTLQGNVRLGQNIARAGTDCKKDQVLLRSGQKLTPAAIAVAASVGAGNVAVFARPRVAVLSSGDELVAIDEAPRIEQIRNSNGVMMAALLRKLGCDVVDRGWVKDDPAVLKEAIAAALRECDALFITGGMSMGEYDFVPRVLKEIGADLKITKLKIKPGKPFVFAAQSSRFIFGLPGNPVSAFTCTVRLASRLLVRMSGGSASDMEQWVSGALADPLSVNGPREFYQPAVLNRDATITPLTWKGSADIYTLASANALLVRAENEPARPSGSVVHALQLPI